MKIKAVLFDYDGVLVSSMDDLCKAWGHAVAIYGNVKLSKSFFFSLEGKKPAEIAEEIVKKYNLDKSIINKLVEEKDKYYLTHNNFSLNQKVVEIVDLLKNNDILVGLVSGAARVRIEQTLPKNVFNKFNVIITADEVTFGKPNPQPYKNALKKLGIKPENALVVENAPLGIESARNAKIYCVAVCSTLSEKKLQGANHIIKNFDELYDYFILNYIV